MYCTPPLLIPKYIYTHLLPPPHLSAFQFLILLSIFNLAALLTLCVFHAKPPLCHIISHRAEISAPLPPKTIKLLADSMVH